MQVNNSFFLTITFTLILLFGLTFVASSSVFEGFELSGDPFYFAKRQFIFVIELIDKFDYKISDTFKKIYSLSIRNNA